MSYEENIFKLETYLSRQINYFPKTLKSEIQQPKKAIQKVQNFESRKIKKHR